MVGKEGQMTLAIKLEQNKKFSSAGKWTVEKDGTHQCGNVKLKLMPADERSAYLETWRIFVLEDDEWQMLDFGQRTCGYSKLGAAKVGAAMIAAHQRGAYK